MCGRFRKATCLGMYHDLDCQDCAMQILIQVCQYEDLPCDGMAAFSKDRKAVLQNLMDQGNKQQLELVAFTPKLRYKHLHLVFQLDQC